MLRTIDDILKNYNDKTKLNKFVIENLPKEILDIMEHLAGHEFCADYVFQNDSYNYDKDKKYYDVDRDYVIIAASGTGDEWVYSFDTKTIWFIDHEKYGDYGSLNGAVGVKDMEITFEQFVVLADLAKQVEDIYLDDSNYDEGQYAKNFKKEMLKISENLINIYPYDL